MGNSDEHFQSRRKLMGGIGVGLLAAAVHSPAAFAQKNEKTKDTNEVKPLQDPTTLYPKPPFESWTAMICYRGIYVSF